VGLVAVPGSALGALGVVWAVKGHKRKWFAWMAFGVNFVAVFMLGLGLLLQALGFGR